MTKERLLTKAYEAIARNGEATNSGPDFNTKPSGSQMLLFYQDIIWSEQRDDVVRVNSLLVKAQNNFGS